MTRDCPLFLAAILAGQRHPAASTTPTEDFRHPDNLVGFKCGEGRCGWWSSVAEECGIAATANAAARQEAK